MYGNAVDRMDNVIDLKPRLLRTQFLYRDSLIGNQPCACLPGFFKGDSQVRPQNLPVFLKLIDYIFYRINRDGKPNAFNANRYELG